MAYIKLDTQQYPVREGEIRMRERRRSFPTPFRAPEGYALVENIPQPVFDPLTQRVFEGKPAEVNGAWQQTWVVEGLPQEQVDANRAAQRQRLIQTLTAQTQRRLDTFAQTRKYDNILTLCSYASSTNPAFAAEGQYGVHARDITWAKLSEILAEIEAATRQVTSWADIEAEMPLLAWPV